MEALVNACVDEVVLLRLCPLWRLCWNGRLDTLCKNWFDPDHFRAEIDELLVGGEDVATVLGCYETWVVPKNAENSEATEKYPLIALSSELGSMPCLSIDSHQVPLLLELLESVRNVAQVINCTCELESEALQGGDFASVE